MESVNMAARRKLEEMRPETQHPPESFEQSGSRTGKGVILARSPSSTRDGGAGLLDLPGEVLSLISGQVTPFGRHIAPLTSLHHYVEADLDRYLSLPDLIPFLSLHPTLLQLTRSHLSPIRSVIYHILSTSTTSSDYPDTLGKLPLLSLYLPQDPVDAGKLFIPLLSRAEPRWIVETLHHGRWPESVWKEAFERRFLPSWKRYKEEEDDAVNRNGSGSERGVARKRKRDTWKAAFLRVLGKLEHRESGCTHQEAWTRFVTLHRNGSASLNRIYSRQFDPYEIFAELKHQNNFADEPTTVRVVLHLADVRILAVGVLLDRPNMFVNRNAHDVLHPPGLRALREARLARMEREMGDSGVVTASNGVVGRDKGKGKVKAMGSSLASATDTTAQRSARITATARAHRLSEPLIPTSAMAHASATGTFMAPTTGPTTSMPANNLSRAITINPNPTMDNATPSSDQTPSEPPKIRRSTFSSLFSRTWSSSSGPADSQNTVSAALIPLVSSSGSVGNSGSAPGVGSSSGWLGSMLTQVRSRDSAHEDTKRKKSFGRKGSGSSAVIPAAALFGEVGWGPGSKSRRSSVSVGTAGPRSEGAVLETTEAGELGAGEGSGSGVAAMHGVIDTLDGAQAGPGPETSRLAVTHPAAGEEEEAEGSEEDARVDVDAIVKPHSPPQLDLAYPTMLHPQPAHSHRFYPNMTPCIPDPSTRSPEQVLLRQTLLRCRSDEAPHSGDTNDEPEQHTESTLMDRRAQYDEIEDDYAGYLFSQEMAIPWAVNGSESQAGNDQKRGGSGYASGGDVDGSDTDGERDVRRYVEWQEGVGRRRWVGPMLIIAQLHSPTLPTAQPPYVPLTSPTEGPNPNLGAKGTYVSLGFEDIDALFPWLRLKGEGAYASSAKRGGMGFAAAGD